MSRTPPDPSGAVQARPIPAGCALHRARGWSGLPRGVRFRLHVERDQLVDQLRQLDDALLVLAGERLRLLRALGALRDDLWPVLPEWNGRRPPLGDSPPLAPLHPAARPLRGWQLRRACLGILRRHGEQDLRDLHSLLHHYGYAVGGSHPVKTLADALGYETRCGRADRVRRGRYRVGCGPGADERVDDPPLGAGPSAASSPDGARLSAPRAANPPHPGADAEEDRARGTTPPVTDVPPVPRRDPAPDGSVAPPVSNENPGRELDPEKDQAPGRDAGPVLDVRPLLEGLEPRGQAGPFEPARLRPFDPPWHEQRLPPKDAGPAPPSRLTAQRAGLDPDLALDPPAHGDRPGFRHPDRSSADPTGP